MLTQPGSPPGVIEVWHTWDGCQLARLTIPAASIHSVAFLPSMRWAPQHHSWIAPGFRRAVLAAMLGAHRAARPRSTAVAQVAGADMGNRTGCETVCHTPGRILRALPAEIWCLVLCQLDPDDFIT